MYKMIKKEASLEFPKRRMKKALYKEKIEGGREKFFVENPGKDMQGKMLLLMKEIFVIQLLNRIHIFEALNHFELWIFTTMVAQGCR